MRVYFRGPDDFEIVDCPDCGGIAVQDDSGDIECCEDGCPNNTDT